MRDIIDRLRDERILTRADFKILIQGLNNLTSEYLYRNASNISQIFFQNNIYIRGLIECTNFCKNDCYYCGIRRSNGKTIRYRLSKEDILACCKKGYELGFRTFVLQGGEDGKYTDEYMIDIISTIKNLYPDCALTLSFGEKTYRTYEDFYKAGADRYLLRHETSDLEHYRKLHPKELTIERRKECLWNLKEIGYQVGAGFMVGSPYQTVDNIIDDLLFLYELQPHMIGIGPFISHKDTPFAGEPNGELDRTLHLIAILRLMFPNALIPSTTALGTIDQKGRELGILAGANVVMPNLSPIGVRKKYDLYDNKICTGDEAADCIKCLGRRMNRIGYELAVDRGDYVPLSVQE